MDNQDSGIYGRTRAASKEPNHLQLYAHIRNEHPRSTRREREGMFIAALIDLERGTLVDPERVLTALQSVFDNEEHNWYSRRDREPYSGTPLDMDEFKEELNDMIEKRRTQRQERRKEMDRYVEEGLSRFESTLAAIVDIENWTGAQCTERGGWLLEVGKRVPTDELVGKHLNRDELLEIWKRSATSS